MCVLIHLDRVEELALADVTIGSHGVGDELHLDDAAPAGAFVHLIALCNKFAFWLSPDY